MRKCSWLATKSSTFIKKTCKRKIAYSITTLDEILSPAQAICRRTCDSCDICFENKKTRYTQNLLSDGTKVFKRCKFLSTQNEAKKKKICSREFSENGYPKPEDACPMFSCSLWICNDIRIRPSRPLYIICINLKKSIYNLSPTTVSNQQTSLTSVSECHVSFLNHLIPVPW